MALKVIFAAMLMSGVASAAPPADRLDQPGYEAPAKPWSNVEQAELERRCRHRIEQARTDAGKPKLEGEPADAEKPLLIYAVDHRMDGCGVLVPVNDPADVRSPPPPSKPRVQPAR